MRLFTYCIPVDDGAAPNPFWGICTLAICKPVIRRVAKVGDWVAGVGSVNVRGKSYKNMLVYAMKVTQKLTMQEYDTYCINSLPQKISNMKAKDYRKNVGDCIYNYTTGKPVIRKSVHNKDHNQEHDINGKYVLLSNHFYYFGDNAILLPDRLYPVVKQGQAHKSNANEPFKLDFIDWLEKTDFAPNTLHGKPQFKLDFSTRLENCNSHCKSDC